MDYKTARNFLIDQGMALESHKNPDAFLMRLQMSQAPIPGQVTSILLALKVILDTLETSPMIDKELILALHLLSMESVQKFQLGLQKGVIWSPILGEDIERIGLLVKNIFTMNNPGNN